MRGWRHWILAAVVVTGAAAALTPRLVDAGEAERKATLELMQLVVPRETYDDMITKMIAAIKGSMVQGGALPADFDVKMHAAMLDVLPYDTVLSWSADVYGSRFTVEEIKQIGAFYKTPVGRKLVKQLPDVSAEVMRKTSETLGQRLPGALKKHGLLPPDPSEAPAQP
jgi:hypothetical protein